MQQGISNYIIVQVFKRAGLLATYRIAGAAAVQCDARQMPDSSAVIDRSLL